MSNLCKYKNNPLNIRFVSRNKWRGLTGCDHGFCTFDTLEHGYRAAGILLLRTYRKKDCYTIRSIIKRFAPASENPTEAYISFVCAKTGFSADKVLSSYGHYASVLWAMSAFEQGHDVLGPFAILDILVSNVPMYGRIR